MIITIDKNGIRWGKSDHSGSNASCVEVAAVDGVTENRAA
jgi:hypothetical protein